MLTATTRARSLSVRIDHEGIGSYFPLQTTDPSAAAFKAAKAYQTIVQQGWKEARRQFIHELTIAFRWIENPLAWTYTTIHTLREFSAIPAPQTHEAMANKCAVAIVEPDNGVRQALSSCVNQMDKFYCSATFTSPARALAGLTELPVRLVLIGHSLGDGQWLERISALRRSGSEIATLKYSAYASSEELFAATPGGAAWYLLRRRLPTDFLEPLDGISPHAGLTNKELVARAWNYFKHVVSSQMAQGPGQFYTNLTQREHQVLGLLSNGYPDKEIAERLGISIYTVHEHVRNIFEKLGVHNRTGAVVKYLQK